MRSNSLGKKSVREQARLQQSRNALRARIQFWQTTQDVYMPCVAPLREEDNEDAENNADADDSADPDDGDDDDGNEDLETRATDLSAAKAEDIQLWLPSALPEGTHLEGPGSSLRRIEIELRQAQAHDALSDLRRLRRLITGISQFRQINISGTGQRANTRIRTMYNKFQGKVKLAAKRYREAYKSLTSLDVGGAWSVALRPLYDEDIRGPGKDNEDIVDPRQGRHEISWIWLVPSVTPSEQECSPNSTEFVDGTRVEWTTAKARVDRWSEEKEWLIEEMGLVVHFLEWEADWWMDQRSRRQEQDPTLTSGISAYAEQQADICRRLATKFARLWLPFLREQHITPEWSARYSLNSDDDAMTSESSDADTEGSADESVSDDVNEDDEPDQ